MTKQIQMKRLLSVMWVALAAALAGACTTSREPISMVEPSYSYMRDVQPQLTASKLFVTQEALVESNADAERVFNVQPMAQTVDEKGAQATLNEPSAIEMFELSGGSFMFEMARSADQKP